eukprot:CAMPEP_0182590488 /NCGR_PEP_ID=MMETSP1324-20130603/71757_1 /TAXON_ID=236786 /ORGANISM="Florenciella sp., Strain RCC1587" /LENGTH=126 /DNA_ID=CAMNT_0024807711 /DNA_START=120 /DNA_END=500 /DNA_ORIENTATION=+
MPPSSSAPPEPAVRLLAVLPGNSRLSARWPSATAADIMMWVVLEAYCTFVIRNETAASPDLSKAPGGLCPCVASAGTMNRTRSWCCSRSSAPSSPCCALSYGRKLSAASSSAMTGEFKNSSNPADT